MDRLEEDCFALEGDTLLFCGALLYSRHDQEEGDGTNAKPLAEGVRMQRSAATVDFIIV